jgi:hypothetical protein
MRILFVCDTGCVHTARWVAQLQGTGWDLHLFDPCNRLVHESLENVHIYTGWKKPLVPRGTRIHYRWPFLRARHFMARNFPAIWKLILPDAEKRLARLIRRLKPDCIHGLGLQDRGAFVLGAKKFLGGELDASWIYSCQGSDIYFFRQFPDQAGVIREVLEGCDFYMCNCDRDVQLARENGLRGEVLGLFQGGGGFPIDEMRAACPVAPASRRRVIAVKGLETQFGNALLTIEALRRCAATLSGYKIKFYQAHAVTREAAQAFAEETRLDVEIIPRINYREFWTLFGEARLAIGVSRSDGVPNTMIEAMILGAFPVQTDPGGASAEWIEHGRNGLLVPHDDPDAIAAAVTQGLSDDALVDAAAKENLTIARARVDGSQVRPRVLAAYRRATAGGGQRH